MDPGPRVRSPGLMARGGLPGAIVLALHVGIFFAFGGATLFDATPYHGGDFDTHIGQAWRFVDAMEGWGKTWVYDVGLLAGYPNGTIFDADNKGWELWTYLGTRLGLSRGLAFNLFVVAAHLGVPVVVYAGARLFDLSPRAAAWSAAAASGVWYFDGWAHWCWHIGMVAYALASYLWILPLALFHRWLEDRRSWQAVACAFAMGVAHLVHPYSFFILVVPMLALWLRSARTLGAAGHATVVAIAAFTVLFNGWWLAVAWRFWHYLLDSAFFGRGGLAQLPADLFGLLLDPTTTGVIGNRGAFRWLALGAAVAVLVVWRREGDRRFLPFALGAAVLAAVTYLGAYTPLTQIQPYRHALPLAMMAALLAGEGVDRLARSGALGRIERPARVAFGLSAALAGLHLLRDVTYYFVPLMPRPQVMPDGQHTGYTAFGTGPIYDYRLVRRRYDALVEFVRAVDDGSGRFLVEGPLFGEHLVWATDAQILGGFTQRNLGHSHANFFRRYPQGIATGEELRRYVDRYAVHWVVTTTPPAHAPWWDAPLYADVLEKVAEHGPMRAYRVKAPTSLIKAGAGPQARVEASTNRIAVFGTRPDRDVVLRFHWLETLVCAPECDVTPHGIGKPRLPFIRVPAPHPADFVITNDY